MSLMIVLFEIRGWVGSWKHPIIRLLGFKFREGGNAYSLFATWPNASLNRTGLGNFNGVIEGRTFEFFGIKLHVKRHL